LEIVGEGAERTKLEDMIAALGLENRVALPGATKSITDWYSSSHLFCLPSRWEGFPNALAEALAHGLPAIGFAESAGVRDLVIHRRSGLLADGNGEVGNLVGALETAMSNDALRRRMGEAAIESTRQFDPPRIFSQWEEILAEVACR
jgi:glycosyltransferase involved in cell wall biosynthesis